jgi:hypothetical protein
MDRRDFIKLAAASVAGVAAAKWLVDLPGPPDVHDGKALAIIRVAGKFLAKNATVYS